MMRRTINRIPLAGRPEAYDTFSLKAPTGSHYRTATCAEVDCRAWRAGWVTVIDTTTRLGANQADYIRHQAGRWHTEEQLANGCTRFAFQPGQTCFAADQHMVPVEREPFYLRWRGARRVLGPIRRYDRSDQWVDDFATHQDHLKHQLEG